MSARSTPILSRVSVLSVPSGVWARPRVWVEEGKVCEVFTKDQKLTDRCRKSSVTTDISYGTLQ